MPYQWNPGWSGGVLVVFFVFSPVLALLVRRKWRLAEIRRLEVIRLVRLAEAEAAAAEKEAAAAFIGAVEKPVSVADGGGVGMLNCAVCHNPTTTRCSRCKAVKYCSGTCQISHWRQGHKYECHPPLIVDHNNNQPIVSDLKGVQNERPESSGNDSGIERKDQSVSNIVLVQSEPSALIDRKSDIEVKQYDDRGRPNVSDLKEVQDERPETSGNSLGVMGKGHVDQSVSNVIEAQSEPSVLVFSKSDTEVRSNDTKRLESFSTIPVSLESNLSSVIDTDQANLPTFRDATTTAGSLSDAFFASDLQPRLMHVNDETEIKLSAPLNMNSPSPDKSTDARISKNDREFSPMGLGSVNHDKSKTSKLQSCHKIHLQPGSEVHVKMELKLSSMKSCSAVANRDQSNFRETASLVIGNSGEEVAKESNNEQLKFVSHNYPKDIKPFLRNGSSKAENIPPISDKSLMVDGSLTNGKVSSWKSVQRITPSSSLSSRSQSGLSNYGHGKYNYKMLFPYDNFIRLYNSDKVEMRPCGLVNFGNSCYANAVLQCLAFTRPLAAFILEGFHAKACPKIGWCFACEFETLLIKVKQGKSPVSPSGIIFHIHDIGSNFGHGREEDAHEFLRYSIDALQSACLKEAGASIAGKLAEETTLIQLIFGGYLRSKIKCMRCQGKSKRRERMMDLTIDIHGDIGTLEEALARFTESEILEGENKYKCCRCQSFERAKKKLTILEAPNVLTIALKRYQSGKYGKLNRMVRFSEYLNLAPYMRGSDDNSPVYRLYAVVVHSGNANETFSGHYVCYVKNTQGNWFKTDDSVVKQVDLQKVLSQGAYILLYARCSPRGPSLLRKEMAKKMKSKENNKSPHDRAGHRAEDPFDGERFRRPPTVDSLSDVSSLFSCSDEGSSWSTESTKDSAFSDDLTDYSLSESGYSNSPRRVSVSSDASSLDSMKADGESGSSQRREGLKFLYRNLAEQQDSSRSSTDWVNSREAKSNVLFRRNGGDRTDRSFY